MMLVKFDHSVKYNGVRHAAHEVFKADEKDMEQLKKAGAIVMGVEEPKAPEQEANGEGEHSEEDVKEGNGEDVAELKEKLLGYTVAELVKYAEENDIDLQGKTRKADIYNIIIATIQ